MQYAEEYLKQHLEHLENQIVLNDTEIEELSMREKAQLKERCRHLKNAILTIEHGNAWERMDTE